MHAIVIAAGLGSRLRPYTDDRPKCLVPVRGKPILAWQMDALLQNGIERITVIRGYRGHALEEVKLPIEPRFVDNEQYTDNNVLLSLFCARALFEEPFLCCYGDLVYSAEVIAALLASPHASALVVDTNFRSIYEGRDEHPLAEAEVCALDDDGRIRNVGKRAVPAEDAWGEFAGVARFDGGAARRFAAETDALVAKYRETPSAPFVRAPAFQKAYLCDMFQYMIDDGHELYPVPITSGLREIDTQQDLERAERVGW